MATAPGVMHGRQPCLDRTLMNRLLEFPLVCWRQNNNGYYCAHQHPGIEYLYVSRGGGVFLAEQHELPFAAPVLLTFQSQMPHGVKVWGDYRRWSMCYLPDALNAAAPIGPDLTAERRNCVEMVRVPKQYRKRLIDLFYALSCESDRSIKFTYEIIGLRLQELDYIFRRLQDDSSMAIAHDAKMATLPASYRITILLSLIEARLCDDLPVDEVAGCLHYSRSQIYRIIHEATGLPYSAYLRQRRVERAKQLLAVTDLPIGDIAQKVGIPHLSQFYRAFRQITGATPKNYRLMRQAPQRRNDC